MNSNVLMIECLQHSNTNQCIYLYALRNVIKIVFIRYCYSCSYCSARRMLLDLCPCVLATSVCVYAEYVSIAHLC